MATSPQAPQAAPQNEVLRQSPARNEPERDNEPEQEEESHQEEFLPPPLVVRSYQEEEEKKRAERNAMRIENFTAMVMFIVAVGIDGLQFMLLFLNVIPIAGTALAFILNAYIGLVGVILFTFWFKFCHVQFLRGRAALGKTGSLLSSAIMEPLGLSSAVPTLMWFVGYTIIVTRLEDVFGNDGEADRAVTNAPSQSARARLTGAMGKAFLAGKPFLPFK